MSTRTIVSVLASRSRPAEHVATYQGDMTTSGRLVNEGDRSPNLTPPSWD
ncbi:hypothetical protein [Rubidibacter lacunae]|nr:hypothetical protein [Rubidibacter lacunae]